MCRLGNNGKHGGHNITNHLVVAVKSVGGGDGCNLKRNGSQIRVTQPYNIPSLHGPCKVRLPFVLELERGVVHCAEGKDETRPVVRGCQKLFPKIEARQALPPEVLSHSEDQRTQFKTRVPRERGKGPTGLDLRGERGVGEDCFRRVNCTFSFKRIQTDQSYHIFTVADTTDENKEAVTSTVTSHREFWRDRSFDGGPRVRLARSVLGLALALGVCRWGRGRDG